MQPNALLLRLNFDSQKVSVTAKQGRLPNKGFGILGNRAMNKDSPEVISRNSVDSVPNPCIKCCIDIASRIDNSGPDKAS
jgi:hypothetical protein